MLSRGRAVAALLALLLATAARGVAAQETRQATPAMLRPGIGAEDPRQAVDPEAEPWRALGRVQTELGTRCTGALIGPRTVLTAAHCLIAPRAQHLVQPGSVHFMLGYHLGRYVAHARVTAYSVGPGFRAAPPGPGGADWALLTLDQAVGTPGRILRLLREPPAPRTPLMLGGYQRDRPEVLMADTGCRSLGLQRGGDGQPLLVHDCAGTRGVSGAPVLAHGPDGHWAIAGVASSVSPDIALGRAVPATSVGSTP